jgi:hypothetical protein
MARNDLSFLDYMRMVPENQVCPHGDKLPGRFPLPQARPHVVFFSPVHGDDHKIRLLSSQAHCLQRVSYLPRLRLPSPAIYHQSVKCLDGVWSESWKAKLNHPMK